MEALSILFLIPALILTAPRQDAPLVDGGRVWCALLHVCAPQTGLPPPGRCEGCGAVREDMIRGDVEGFSGF